MIGEGGDLAREIDARPQEIAGHVPETGLVKGIVDLDQGRGDHGHVTRIVGGPEAETGGMVISLGSFSMILFCIDFLNPFIGRERDRIRERDRERDKDRDRDKGRKKKDRDGEAPLQKEHGSMAKDTPLDKEAEQRRLELEMQKRRERIEQWRAERKKNATLMPIQIAPPSKNWSLENDEDDDEDDGGHDDQEGGEGNDELDPLDAYMQVGELILQKSVGWIH